MSTWYFTITKYFKNFGCLYFSKKITSFSWCSNNIQHIAIKSKGLPMYMCFFVTDTRVNRHQLNNNEYKRHPWVLFQNNCFQTFKLTLHIVSTIILIWIYSVHIYRKNLSIASLSDWAMVLENMYNTHKTFNYMPNLFT